MAFTSQQGAIGDIFIKRAGGGDAPELLVTSKTIKHPNDWSRDGQFLIYDDHHPFIFPVETHQNRTRG